MSSFENVSEKPAMASESSIPEPLFSTKTPDKTTILPTRSRNSDVSLSFPDIKPQGSRYPIKPVKRQLLASPQKPEITIKLPERFEILGELFNGLDTAIRLLKLKGSLTTFANICPKIEYLTNRIFSYDHLAQMKHIYPEAIEIKRVLKCDEDTSCMNPSLHVKLNTDAIVPEDANCGTKHMQLRKVFHSKLVDFYKAHPKDEIPKELLPEPFNSSKRDSCSDTISVDLGASKLENEGFDIQMEEMEKEQHRVDKVVPDSTLLFGTEECLLSHTESRIVGTPVKDLSTPSRDLSTPIRLMSATPTLQPSRRCITMTPPDDDNDSIRSTNGLERRSSRTKCLNFDTLEEDGTAKAGDISNVSYDEGINYEADDVSDEESLVHSMKEKPKPETEKQDLPKLVNLIHKLFHATKRTIITKEELLHKIIACQINITDTKEVEEQYRLMLQLVPDWISETKASSGHFLVRINKMSTAETVCARLDEATSQGISSVY
ncbi:CDT1-like protein b [Eutrema salsugineum]|uniref:CDT1-like protein b n=1 Tax=Eutrema salsugineum TaxID=72664 RepID=UPI000CED2616|nr:CDT1-like protein b [Eutrema salsugineum]